MNFRWKDRRGKTIRSERATSLVCKQPDTRPDLVVRNVRFEDGQYVATIFNRGRDSAAGPFAVDFIVDGAVLGTVEIVGLAPQTPVTAMLPGAQVPARDAARGGRRPALGGRRGRRGERLAQRRLLSQSATASQ